MTDTQRTNSEHIHGEQCPFCSNYGSKDSAVCSSCGKHKRPAYLDGPPKPRDSVELGDLREAGEDDD
jgi:hypothetical protein